MLSVNDDSVVNATQWLCPNMADGPSLGFGDVAEIRHGLERTPWSDPTGGQMPWPGIPEDHLRTGIFVA